MHSKAWITDADPSLIYRVVGFLEYASALRNLDELVQIATPDELKAIDELIRERPEFTVFTNLSADLLSQPSTLVPIGGNPNTERRGLVWVLALARVELGGILATFGAHPDPFSVVGPTELEWNAYRDLLLDDAEAHFWSLTRDANLERVAKSTPDTPMLAYIRRLSLARQLLLAAGIARRDELTQAQLAELSSQDKQLTQARDLFRLAIATFLSAHTGRREFSTRENHNELVNACGAQLKAEPGELAEGLAFEEKIQTTDQAIEKFREQ